MCGPGMLTSVYDKDDPSTWRHWEPVGDRTNEEALGRSWGGEANPNDPQKYNPLWTEDGRYDVLSGQRFSVGTGRGGLWGGDEHLYAKGNLRYAMDQIDKEWDHKAELERIKTSSQTSLVAGSGGSGRGYSSSTRGGRGSASTSSGLGITTGDIISNRGAT